MREWRNGKRDRRRGRKSLDSQSGVNSDESFISKNLGRVMRQSTHSSFSLIFNFLSISLTQNFSLHLREREREVQRKRERKRERNWGKFSICSNQTCSHTPNTTPSCLVFSSTFWEKGEREREKEREKERKRERKKERGRENDDWNQSVVPIEREN